MPFHVLKTLGRRAALTLVAAILVPAIANAQACPQRGELDARFCDANGDLLADLPADKAAQKNPDTLIFSFTPVEDPSVYENAFSDLLAHISRVTGKRVR